MRRPYPRKVKKNLTAAKKHLKVEPEISLGLMDFVKLEDMHDELYEKIALAEFILGVTHSREKHLG